MGGVVAPFVPGRMTGTMGGPSFPLSALWGLEISLLTTLCQAKASVILITVGEHFGAVALLAS